MKILKLFMLTIVSIILVSFSIFMFYCLNDDYNEAVLAKLEGNILYLKRDDDSVLKLYKNTASLENEKLIYEHHSAVNANIIEFTFDENSQGITFVAFDDQDQRFEYYDVSLDGSNVVAHNQAANTKFDEEQDLDGIYSDYGTMMQNKNGDVQILKSYKGSYDGKFSTGYTPIALTADKKFLFYYSSDHLSPIGALLEGLIFNTYGNMYIMDLSTKESSQYVDFYGDVVFYE